MKNNKIDNTQKHPMNIEKNNILIDHRYEKQTYTFCFKHALTLYQSTKLLTNPP